MGGGRLSSGSRFIQKEVKFIENQDPASAKKVSLNVLHVCSIKLHTTFGYTLFKREAVTLNIHPHPLAG